MPPEAMEGGHYNEKLDIFSYSHLAIHVIIQTYPLPKNPTYYVGATLVPRTEVERRQPYLTEMKSYLDGGQHPFYSIVLNGLANRPDPRPSCEQIISILPMEL